MAYRILTLNIIDTKGTTNTGIYAITPAVAAAIMATRNENNRNVSGPKLAQLVSDVSTGKFVLNGESISFDWNGQLHDGQHRLSAVIKAGKSIVSNVVMNVDPRTKATVDQGIARTICNYLQMSGYHNASTLGSMGNYLLGYSLGDGTGFGRVGDQSKGAVMEFIKNTPKLQDITTWAVNMRPTLLGIATPSQIAIARGILEPIYGQDAVNFLERVGIGDNISRNHAAFTVRSKLQRTTAPSNMFAVELLMRAFLAHRLGHSYTKVVIHGELPKLAKRASNLKPAPIATIPQASTAADGLLAFAVN